MHPFLKFDWNHSMLEIFHDILLSAIEIVLDMPLIQSQFVLRDFVLFHNHLVHDLIILFDYRFFETKPTLDLIHSILFQFLILCN